MLWKDGWMDGSMITSLKRGTSIDAITEISGVQRQFLGIRFCFDDLEEVSNLHAACIQFEVFILLHLEPGDARRYPWTSSLVRSMLNLTCVTQVVYSLFGSPFPLHSEHILIHEGSGALVVKSFAQKETNARTYPVLNRSSSKLVYPSFHMKLYLGFTIGTSFYHFFSLIKLVLVATSTIPNSRKFQQGGGLTPRL